MNGLFIAWRNSFGTKFVRGRTIKVHLGWFLPCVGSEVPCDSTVACRDEEGVLGGVTRLFGLELLGARGKAPFSLVLLASHGEGALNQWKHKAVLV